MIEVNVLGRAGFDTAGTASSSGSFTDTEENPGSYSYRVKFVQGANESPYSAATLNTQLAIFYSLYLPTIRR